MARAAERGGARLLLLPLLLALPAAAARPPASFPSDVNGHSLHPPYFNLAEGTRISATATCGEEATGAGGRRAVEDLYCKLVGGPVAGGDPNQTIQVRPGRGRRGRAPRLAEPRRGGAAGVRSSPSPLCAPPVLGVAAERGGCGGGSPGLGGQGPAPRVFPRITGGLGQSWSSSRGWVSAGGSGRGGPRASPCPGPPRSSGAVGRTCSVSLPALPGVARMKRGSLSSRDIFFKVAGSFVFLKSRANQHPNSLC